MPAEVLVLGKPEGRIALTGMPTERAGSVARGRIDRQGFELIPSDLVRMQSEVPQFTEEDMAITIAVFSGQENWSSS